MARGPIAHPGLLKLSNFMLDYDAVYEQPKPQTWQEMMDVMQKFAKDHNEELKGK